MKVAIIGATGAVGREMVEDLADSSITGIELSLFASPRSAGQRIHFQEQNLAVKPFSMEALKGFDFILMSAGGAFSKEYAKGLAAQGAYVIDNSSAWRMEDTVPLIVPEVNGDLLKHLKSPGIIANPNCSTIQMVIALNPLHKAFGLRLVQVASYQSVSGTGQKGMMELAGQVEKRLKFQDIEPVVYAQPIAFNLLPAIDILDSEGHCLEEIKMIKETRRIMSLSSEFAIFATTVRVPTYNCHGEAITVQLEKSVTRDDLLNALGTSSTIALDSGLDYVELPTPHIVTSSRKVHVSRVRVAFGQKRSSWAQFWNIADNLKIGAATNAVKILETLINYR